MRHSKGEIKALNKAQQDCNHWEKSMFEFFG
jgi:hypothetical protein